MINSFPQNTGLSTPTKMNLNVGIMPTFDDVPVSKPINIPSECVLDPSKSLKVENITREELVIRRIMDDPKIQNKVLPYLTPDIFSSNFKGICKAMVAFNSVYKRFPSASELMVGLPDDSPERFAFSRLMGYPIDTISNDVSASLIVNYFKETLTEKVIMEAAVRLNANGGRVENLVELVKELEKSINFDLSIDIGLSARDDMHVIIERLNTTLSAIPSALSDIRKYTETDTGKCNGGWFRTALGIYLGQPNIGKTIMLCNDAAYAYKCGYNVLYVSLEMAEEFIHQRIISNVCDIYMKDVKSQNPDELLREYEKNAFTTPGNLIVRKMPTTTTVVEIESTIIEINRSMGINIDLLVVDYIGIMKPMKRSNSVQNLNMYLMGKEVAEQLRDLGDKYKIPVLTASQLTRDGYANLSASIKDTANSSAINDVADFMVTIMQDPMLKSLGLIMHTIVKSRFGENGISFYSSINYGRMRVVSASDADLEKYHTLLGSQPQSVPGLTTKPKPVINVTQPPPPKTPEQIKLEEEIYSNFNKGNSNNGTTSN